MTEDQQDHSAPGIADPPSNPGGAGLPLPVDARKLTPDEYRAARVALIRGQQVAALNRHIDNSVQRILAGKS